MLVTIVKTNRTGSAWSLPYSIFVKKKKGGGDEAVFERH